MKKTLFDCKSLKLLTGVWKAAKRILCGEMSFLSLPSLACFHFGRKMQVSRLHSFRVFTFQARILAIRTPALEHLFKRPLVGKYKHPHERKERQFLA